MSDIEWFLVSLRNHKDADGRLNPIRLADTVAEEVKIVQTAINAARREWVGLAEEEWIELGCRSVEQVRIGLAIEAKLREKNSA